MPKSITTRHILNDESSAIQADEPVSLCTTCDYNPTCIHFKEHKGAIQFCEEYAGMNASTPRTTQAMSEPDRAVSSEVKGLCINCQKLATCVFVRPAEGVWHCEEYA